MSASGYIIMVIFGATVAAAIYSAIKGKKEKDQNKDEK